MKTRRRCTPCIRWRCSWCRKTASTRPFRCIRARSGTSVRSACWSKGGGRRRNRGRGARSRFPAALMPGPARWLCLVLAGLAAAAAATGPAAAVSWAGTPAEAGAEEPQPPATCGPGEPVRIVVVDLETGEELWSAPARAGDEIWYTYTHSADKTPVQSLLREIGRASCRGRASASPAAAASAGIRAFHVTGVQTCALPISAEAGAEEPQPPATCGPGEPVRIVVVDLETGEELWSAPARAGDEIWYTYTHSADKTPVQSLLR